MGYKMCDLRNNSLYERVNKLLVTYEWSDCSFSVCGKKFKAHKLILGISSPVFEAMFYGPLSTNDDITIVDVEPNAFQLLLDYIYTDKVSITSIEEAYDLLYVSRKYMLEYLSDICKEYIHTNLSIDNVVSILNYPDYMQDNELVESALELACQHAKYLLKEKKKQISLVCMQRILKTNNINIKEKDLIKCLFQWTTCYCDQNNVSNDFDTRRDVLLQNGLIELLRFITLSLDDLEEVVADDSNLLIKSEIDDIRQKILVSSNDDIVPRSDIKLKWCLCHRTQIRSESPITIELQNFIISCRIKSNKSTFINSLNVQSRMAPGANYCNNSNNVYQEEFSISIECEADNSIINVIKYKENEKYDSTIDIELPEPVLLKKDVWYKVSFIWPKIHRYYMYSYAVQSRDSCYDNGRIQFDFEDISSATYCGSFLRGLRFCM